MSTFERPFTGLNWNASGGEETEVEEEGAEEGGSEPEGSTRRTRWSKIAFWTIWKDLEGLGVGLGGESWALTWQQGKEG